ncbi:MAG TPA: serine/threonine-protein kinase [Isosphaeraceae bacterium]|jgi:serine/threonine-protein kinase|nr:serine/threonine-protein kinase [Isosphaeraceae bacterium]
MATETQSNPPAQPADKARSAPPVEAPAPAPGAKPAVAAGTGAAKAAPPAAASSGARASGVPGKDARGLSALNESSLEKTVIRRGMATQQEVDACKAHRDKIAANKAEPVGLLEVMVAAKVLTQSQSARLLRELATEAQRKLEIPGYQIIDRLGKGSMGVVYKARQTSVDRVVAVKVLLDTLALNREFIKRFDREAKIAAKLSHNNIVNAIDAGEADGHHFFVMEYVEGVNIKDELDKGKIYEEREALRIVLAVAEALKHASSRGLVHRDIKPENVIVTSEGVVKLADLGLARPTADEQWANAEAGMAIGTPYYISPEQVRGQVDVDIRSDIYSLGATLYHMTTGRVPYDGETPNEVMKKHVDKASVLTPPDHLNTRLSSGLGEVVETMMAKNRDNRYLNPDDLIMDLKCLLQGEAPIIAEQKADALDSLADGDAAEYGAEDYAEGGASEAEMAEMAGYVNSRNNLIAALAILLAVSVVTNVVFLALR